MYDVGGEGLVCKKLWKVTGRRGRPRVALVVVGGWTWSARTRVRAAAAAAVDAADEDDTERRLGGRSIVFIRTHEREIRW